LRIKISCCRRHHHSKSAAAAAMEGIIELCLRENKKSKRNLKFAKHIVTQIRVVNEQEFPKSGYLFDCFAADVDLVSKILERLHSCRLIGDELRVVIVQQDIFVLNIKKVVESVLDSYIFVDVSGNLQNPCLLNDDTKNSVILMLENVNAQLKQHAKHQNTIELQLKDEWSIATIFGYFLNYPIIYYDKVAIDNCLSMIDLKVFQVSVDDDVIISFSVPLEILSSNNSSNNCDSRISTFLERLPIKNDEPHYRVNSFITNHTHVNL
jgi:hypothetical protein